MENKQTKHIIYILLFSIFAVVFTKMLFFAIQYVAEFLFLPLKFIDVAELFLSYMIFKIILFILVGVVLLIIARKWKGIQSESVIQQKVFFEERKIKSWYVLVPYFILMIVIEGIGAYISISSGITALNVPADLYSFIGYLITVAGINPIAEELYFRVLLLLIEYILFKKFFTSERKLFVVLWVSTTMIFTLAHISFTIFPFSVTHLNVPQLISVAIQGSVYYWLYIKYKSIKLSIFAHGVADAIYCIVTYFFVLH